MNLDINPLFVREISDETDWCGDHKIDEEKV